MKQCGSCTLCCSLEKIPEINKSRHVLCQHCDGKGCGIYQTRPQSCRTFECGWLSSDMPDDLRPDRAHLYIARMDALTANIMVDPECPDAWKLDVGRDVVEHVRKSGKHAIIVVGNQVTFLPGHGVRKPEKLLLEWEL